jgi:hypothetical protein
MVAYSYLVPQYSEIQRSTGKCTLRSDIQKYVSFAHDAVIMPGGAFFNERTCAICSAIAGALTTLSIVQCSDYTDDFIEILTFA